MYIFCRAIGTVIVRIKSDPEHLEELFNCVVLGSPVFLQDHNHEKEEDDKDHQDHDDVETHLDVVHHHLVSVANEGMMLGTHVRIWRLDCGAGHKVELVTQERSNGIAGVRGQHHLSCHSVSTGAVTLHMVTMPHAEE